MRRMWVIEMFIKGRWMATVWCALSRDEARLVLRNRDKNLPDDKLRIRRYEPVKK